MKQMNYLYKNEYELYIKNKTQSWFGFEKRTK